MVRIVFRLTTMKFVPYSYSCKFFFLKFNLNDIYRMKKSLCTNKHLWKKQPFCFLQGGIQGFESCGMLSSGGSGPGMVFPQFSKPTLGDR